MIALLCRHRVRDFAVWKSIFDSHTPTYRAAGLHLKQLWCDVDDTNNVFFLFDVECMQRALNFLAAPDAVATAKLSGVINTNYHFLEHCALMVEADVHARQVP